ncbi:MAG: hypothetical protein FWF02_07665 [Micrococcales bacterium]|nr:hypothetical protein [Micrococcales bacterium]MCL2667569.1 hypothetical protein [Micrococcales bacterium]
MSAIHTTVVALVGTALLAVGALTGCSGSGSGAEGTDGSTQAATDAQGTGSDEQGAEVLEALQAWATGPDGRQYCSMGQDDSTMSRQEFIDYNQGLKRFAPSQVGEVDYTKNFDIVIGWVESLSDAEWAAVQASGETPAPGTKQPDAKTAEAMMGVFTLSLLCIEAAGQ